MSNSFIPRDASLREIDLIPPEPRRRRACGPFCPCRFGHDNTLPRCGAYRIHQGIYGPKALNDDGEEPSDWRVYPPALGHIGTILSCHCVLDGDTAYCQDDWGESRCVPHQDEALQLEEDDAC